MDTFRVWSGDSSRFWREGVLRQLKANPQSAEGSAPVSERVYLPAAFSRAHVFPIATWKRSKDEACK